MTHDAKLTVRASFLSETKAQQVRQYLRWSEPGNKAVCKDEKLLRGNVLLAENSKNYRVLLAMGRKVSA